MEMKSILHTPQIYTNQIQFSIIPRTPLFCGVFTPLQRCSLCIQSLVDRAFMRKGRYSECRVAKNVAKNVFLFFLDGTNLVQMCLILNLNVAC